MAMTYSSTDPARRLGRALVLAGFIAGNVVTPALAGPTGGRIVAGQGGIGHSGSTSTITQGSDRLIIEWDSFDTSASESVRFNQPSSSASVLNRIVSGNATIFDGSLFANGNVVIVNGSGIHFGPNSHVDVGSLIASTADISNRNFLDNRLIFDRPGRPDASITNAGTITVRDSGLAALVAPGVENSGLIQANLGTVILAAGEAHTIDFNGDGLMSFAVTKPTSARPKDRNGNDLDALASNSGSIHADGGTVLVTARQASRVLDNAINMSGIARANSVGVRNGKIVLFGGNKGRVNVSGRVSASGKRRGERGGTVHVTGRKVAIPIAKVDVTGKAGGGEVLVGGPLQGGALSGDSTIGYIKSGDLVSILTGANAGAAGDGFFPNAETVTVGADTEFDVSATDFGKAGTAIIWADEQTEFHGSVFARGGPNGGDGGFVEVSAPALAYRGNVDTSAPLGATGWLLLDPVGIRIFSGPAAGGAMPGTDPVLRISDGSLNAFLASTNILLATSPTNADIVADPTNTGSGRGGTGANDDNIIVEAGTAINTGSNTLFFSTTTVDLFADIVGTVAGGLSSSSTLPAPLGPIKDPTTVNVFGSGSGGTASIQDAIDIVGIGGAVNVNAGTYGSFIVNKTGLTIGGTGENTIILAASPAVTVAADDTTVRDMLLQGAGAVDDVGILLDGTTAQNLTGVSITNVDFSNLDVGIRSQGDIGDDDPSTVDVTIRGNSNMDPALFTDFLDAAIDVGDSDRDANYLIQDVIIRDGNDADMFATGSDGIRFSSIGAATISGVAINMAGDDGIQFSSNLVNPTILIGGNNITSFFNSVFFVNQIEDANVRIAGNTLVSEFSDGIIFSGNIIDSDIVVGGASAADGNDIFGTSDGIDIDDIIGGSFVIANNTRIIGADMRVGDGLEFDRPVQNNADVQITDNALIRGGNEGILFIQRIASSTVTISGNTAIEGNSDNGIRFQGRIENGSNVRIAGNTSIIGVTNGINVLGFIGGNSEFQITDNGIGLDTARVGGNGITFEGGILDAATVTIGGANQVFAAGRAINVNDLQSPSTLSITGGTYDGTGGALLVDNTGEAGTNGLLNVGTAAYFAGAGSNVFEVRTDLGNAGVDIDFSGAATFTGGATGVRLSGPGIDVVNDTFGNIAFSGQAGTFIELADGAEFLPGSPTILNATNVSFDGALASAMTPAQTIALEEGLVHFLDDPTLGLINTGALAVQAGNSIQLAVNAAGLIGGAQTVNVAAGTFGGSVEVWVDDLTLSGRGASTIIDTDAVDMFTNIGDRNNGFKIAAISGLSGGGDVSGVTIRDFAFDSLSNGPVNAGIELGQIATSSAVNSTISSNTFNNVQRGVFSVLSDGNTAITDNTMTAISDIGIWFFDDIVSGESISIVSNNITSTNTSVSFRRSIDNANVRIAGNALFSISGDGIFFDREIFNSMVVIGGETETADGNDISGMRNGIDVDGIIGGSFVVANNTSIIGTDVGFGDGLEFDGAVQNNANIQISDNAMIRGASRGINFLGQILTGIVTITGNTAIEGNGADGISFQFEIGNGSNVVIAGNTSITGVTNGIDVLGFIGGNSELRITDNGIGLSTARVGGHGINFEGGILDTATVAIGGANQVFAAGRAINVNDLQSPSTLSITGGTYDGTGGALLVDNTGEAGTNGLLNVGTAAYFAGAGSNVFEVRTDLGNAGVDIDFSGAATFTGGARGLVLSGPGIDVVNDTFGSIGFSGQTGTFIELANGAEFLPGSPTILDATSVTFDGLLPSAMTVTQAIALENRLVHFPDDPTLGLLNLGVIAVAAGDSIQLAVNRAGLLPTPQTVLVDSGTFGGSVEVWVDDLTLSGQGAATIIDTDAVDLSANNDDVDNGFQIAAISLLSGGGNVSGVTIEGFAFDSLSSGIINTGIELGESATSTAIDATISSNAFDNLQFGIVSNVSDGNTAITDNTMTAIGFSGIVFSDAIISGESISIVGNAVASGFNSVLFKESVDDADIRIAGNTLSSAFSDGIGFSGEIVRANVVIGGPMAADGNDISGDSHGIDIDEIVGGSFIIANNTRIVGMTRDGVQFDGSIQNNADIQITGNILINAGRDGIAFREDISGNSEVRISGNGIGLETARVGGDGVNFRNGILDTATVTIGGTNQVFAAGRAINVNDLQSPSTLSITGGTYDGTGGALLVDNTGVIGTNGRLNVGAAAYTAGAGSNVFEVRTDLGNAGVDIDFSGAATFDGGATGVRLSGPGVDVLNDTFGNIAFSNQTSAFIELADGAEFLPGSPTVLDATGVTFDGLLPSAMTVTQAIALENRLVHFPDDRTLGLLNLGVIAVAAGDSIQLAVNRAGLLPTPQTVLVDSGTFGGSVEVWVDDLTLTGQGATTIIDTDAIDMAANNGASNNGFQIAALSLLSGGGNVSGVTIQGFAFDSLSNGQFNFGIELGQTATSTAINSTISTNTFNNMLRGVGSNLSDGNTAISGNMMTAISDVGIRFVDDIVSGESISIVGNTVTSRNNSIIVLGRTDNADLRIAANTLVSELGDAIIFGGDAINSNIVIGGASAADGNDIFGASDGIDIDDIIGGSFVVANNTRIVGANMNVGDGLEFDSTVQNNANVRISDNALIRGGRTGISFFGQIASSAVTISGNTAIEGNGDNGIHFRDRIENGSDVRIAGNTSITGIINGIKVDGAIAGNSEFRITDNGIGLDTARVGGHGITFEGGILDTATVTIDGANQVFATGRAINVNDLQSPSTLSITGGTFDGTGGALLVDNTGVVGTDGRLNVGAAAYFAGAGSNVFEVRTDLGNAGVDIDFSRAATFTGGATGVRLSGPGIDVVNNTFGDIAFSGQTGTFIELANGAEFLPSSPTVLNATSVSFDGVLASAMTPAQTIALEEKLVHFLDDPTLGLINTGALAVQAGNSIQLAVNAAGLIGGVQTVNVASGTFGGSVEVWVDNLTLAGQGATTIIDTDAIDPFANNGDVNNGFQIAAISRLSGGGDVSGVTIQGFSFDTLTTTGANTGIELGETFAAMSTAIDSTLSNNIINDQTTGILSNLSSGTTAIAGNTLTALGNRGIEFRDTIVSGESISIVGNNVTSRSSSIIFGDSIDSANVRIAGNTLLSETSDGIFFSGDSINSNIVIGGTNAADGNDIFGASDGIDIDNIIGGSFVIANNSRIIGASMTSGDGLEFDRPVRNNADVRIFDNALIQGGSSGINFIQRIASSTVTISGNTAIEGNSDSGIRFRDQIENGSNVQVAGNARIRGNLQGITVSGNVDASTVTIAGNNSIVGDQFSGVDFRRDFVDANVTVGPATISINGVATDFTGNTITGGLFGILHNEGAVIRGTSIVRYNGNSVTGGETGIRFESIIESADVGVSGNSSIVGQSFDGIFFSQPVENNARLTIGNNMISGGSDGIEFLSEIRDNVSVEIAENAIAGANNGVLFRSAVSTANANGVRFIGNSEITGTTGDGILFAAAVTDTSVAMTGNNAVTGAVNGVHFANLSGSTIDVASSTVTGGTTGFKAVGAAVAGTTNALNFANATLRGTIGPGMSVTTNAGGPGVTTNLNGGNSLTGAPALALSGPNQVLVGDTLNDTEFFGVNGGNFVELSDGALFEPGQPTLIDGRMAFFDGVQAPDQSPPALIQAIEDRLIDFDDDNTLGQIFFTPGAPSTPSTPPGEAPAPEFVLTHFPFLLETGVRISNPQSPGDWIQRPDFLFDILFGDLFAMTYPLGGCEPVFDASGALVDIQCIGSAQGSDISPFVDAFMANLNPAGP